MQFFIPYTQQMLSVIKIIIAIIHCIRQMLSVIKIIIAVVPSLTSCERVQDDLIRIFFIRYTSINTLYLLPKICINCCFQFLLGSQFVLKGNWKQWFMRIFGGRQSVSWEQWKQSIHIPFTFIEHCINYMDTWSIILKERTMTFTVPVGMVAKIPNFYFINSFIYFMFACHKHFRLWRVV